MWSKVVLKKGAGDYLDKIGQENVIVLKNLFFAKKKISIDDFILKEVKFSVVVIFAKILSILKSTLSVSSMMNQIFTSNLR